MLLPIMPIMNIVLRVPFVLLTLGVAMAPGQGIAAEGSPEQRMSPPSLGSDANIGPEPMPRILNDTPEYCLELRHDIDAIRNRRGEIPAEPALLVREGERLCQMGHFRPGIYRLRSALMMLRPQP
jgi:hypothetical protein